MARGFNKVVLMGNLTRDPELRSIPSGQQVASFSLAVNRTWKNANGEQQEAVDYIDCNAWGKPGEIITQYMKKGSAILVSGRLQQRQWEQEGQKRSKVEIVVEDFNFVGGPNDGGSSNSSGDGNYQKSSPASDSSSSAPAAKPVAEKKDAPKVEDLGNEPINLDDIPF
jgi:single-strand DNA-binding protein